MSTARHRLALTHDGALELRGDRESLRAVRGWIPLERRRLRTRGTPALAASIDIRRGSRVRVRTPSSSEVATLSLGGVSARCEGEVVVLHGVSQEGCETAGLIDLACRRAQLDLPMAMPNDSPERAQGWAALTLSSAFLLGRLEGGGALVHAAAVVDRLGRAWLLAGDTHSGKTTTCATLVADGWAFLADDQVVLRSGEGPDIAVEGWPRQAHLDAGWLPGGGGDVHGTREPVDLGARWPGRWRRTAPLGGVLFPRVDAARATWGQPIAAAEALGRLVRQSPWLLADPGREESARTLALLARVAALPALDLTLGSDCYGRAGVIRSALGPHVVA